MKLYQKIYLIKIYKNQIFNIDDTERNYMYEMIL